MDKKSYILQLLKYFIMAVIVGIIVGAIDALFGRVLIAISDFRTIHYQYLLPFLPIAEEVQEEKGLLARLERHYLMQSEENSNSQRMED